jgi:hypothetical protein
MMNTDDNVNIDDIDAQYLLLFLAIYYSRLHDHEVIWAYGNLLLFKC